MSAGKEAGKKALGALFGKKQPEPQDKSLAKVVNKVQVRSGGGVWEDVTGDEPIGIALEDAKPGGIVGVMIVGDYEVPNTPVILQKPPQREERVIGSFQGLKAKLDGRMFNLSQLQTIEGGRKVGMEYDMNGQLIPGVPRLKETRITMNLQVSRHEDAHHLQWLVGQPSFPLEFVLCDDPRQTVTHISGKGAMKYFSPSQRYDGGMEFEAEVKIIGDITLNRHDKREFVLIHGHGWL